jgi:hypothetical protein
MSLVGFDYFGRNNTILSNAETRIFNTATPAPAGYTGEVYIIKPANNPSYVGIWKDGVRPPGMQSWYGNSQMTNIEKIESAASHIPDGAYYIVRGFTESGCIDSTANNYDSAALWDDDSCTYDIPGCTDAAANNHDSTATTDDGSCVYDVSGCTDATANNHDSTATTDDGSCTYDVSGCTDATANNHDSTATTDDGSCTYDTAKENGNGNGNGEGLPKWAIPAGIVGALGIIMMIAKK